MNTAGEASYPQALVRDAILRGREQFARLTVLTVKLLFRPSGAVVSLALAPPGVGQQDAGQLDWEVPLSAFKSGVDGSLALPSTLDDDVRFRLDSAGGAPPGAALWLKLARPYGTLGILPWERELGATLDRPVLRLPDYPERPVERPGVLENVVLVDPDNDAAPECVVHRAGVLVDAILRGSARAATRVHLFASAHWYPHLAPLAGDQRVTVYDPQHTQTSAAVAAQGGALGQALRSAPWSDWIAASMAARGVDAVHLLCRARHSPDGADFVLSASPAPGETSRVLVVLHPDELALLLNRAGAWELSLVPASLSDTEPLAMVADSFAHVRPGAVLFHGLANPEDENSLRRACGFLFAREPVDAPRLRGGFVYCHPSFARDSVGPQRGAADGAGQPQVTAASGDTMAPGAAALDTQLDTAPDWVNATQRFVESAVFEQVRKLGPDLLLSTGAAPDAAGAGGAAGASSASLDTLFEIQNVVQDYLKMQRKE